MNYKLHYGWCTDYVLRSPHCTTLAAVKANNKKKMSSFKSNENIRKKDVLYFAVSANKAWSVTL